MVGLAGGRPKPTASIDEVVCAGGCLMSPASTKLTINARVHLFPKQPSIWSLLERSSGKAPKILNLRVKVLLLISLEEVPIWVESLCASGWLTLPASIERSVLAGEHPPAMTVFILAQGC
uniref:Uncharacterized protein n=1 Tax=Setaria viridis TaxID=4556 RepID=A0A4U6TK37_SETVI|nr:hypothetical protein SEVIR_8G173050v2 [Setaria viridis]